ncbi:DNA polymerase III epsilon subunit-like 3'-5' exonuclease [Corynebacterium mustelae]|uniref:DNA polymerase III epsilon subunit-like 3'-5' exonuclease n=1 Tax=Corynebacterium mustelae TaxID=571915 RepID=A0A0G3GWX7_9CORY|nr:3'-5' exonuclease [Corynebacterium mustelae]AKK05641.1 DNA polymerase III epsilon subunit-like 3'-5' exonuclease [Corynebacterium mustelae]
MEISTELLQTQFDPMKVLSFDLETTSANPFEARIVTSALIRVDSEGAHPYEMLADPGIPIPEAAANVHGITTEYAQQHGRPHDDVLKETLEKISQAWADGYTLIVYNAAYDLTVLHSLEPSFVVAGPVYDPFVVDKVLDPYRKGKRTLTDLCEEYNVRLDNAHEATSDALAAARIAWVQAKRRFAGRIKDLTLEELMEFQAVGYYNSQTDLKKYLESRGRDASDVNTTWPMQNSD